MVTKKEYLIEKGLKKPGPGRLSNAAREAIKAAINKGIKFDEPETTTKSITVVTKDENGKKVVKTRRVDDVPQCADPRKDRPKGAYIFENADGSTFVRAETVVCNNCNYSLGWCYCVDGPIIWAYPYAGEACATLREIKASVAPQEVKTTKQPATRGGTRRGGSTAPRRRGRPRKAS